MYIYIHTHARINQNQASTMTRRPSSKFDRKKPCSKNLQRSTNELISGISISKRKHELQEASLLRGTRDGKKIGRSMVERVKGGRKKK